VLKRRPRVAFRGNPAGRFFSALDRGFKRFTARYVAGRQRYQSHCAVDGHLLILTALHVAPERRPRPASCLTRIRVPDRPGDPAGWCLAAQRKNSSRRNHALLRKQRRSRADVRHTRPESAPPVPTVYDATIFIILKPWGQRAGAAHASLGAGGARQQARQRRQGKPTCCAESGPPVPHRPLPAASTSSCFFFSRDRSGGIQKCGRSDPGFPSGRPTSGPNSPASSRNSTAHDPELEYVLDLERAKKLGVSDAGIFGTCRPVFRRHSSTIFNLFGRT